MNIQVRPRVPQHANIMASRLRDYTRISPHMYFGSRSNEDPQDLLDEVYKIIYTMGVTSTEKDELAAHQLKDLAQTWFVQWRDNRAPRGGPVTWEIFKRDLLHRFFPREFRESNLEEFINLHKLGMSILYYSLKFTN